MHGPAGTFVISLDFELYWGMRDRVSFSSYRPNLIGSLDAVPRMLEMFDEFGIHATWAAVGMMFFGSWEELAAHLPRRKPGYHNTHLSPYSYIRPGAGEECCHFAPNLLKRIVLSPHQEIGSHTFSHYYCLEPGQTADDFREDLAAATAAASNLGIDLRSIVLPRNQVNEEYLAVCHEAGFRAYRGTQRSYIYRARAQEEERRPILRLLRLLDAYATISGHNCYRLPAGVSGRLVNVPASRFLRPIGAVPMSVEHLRLLRVLGDMTHAARQGMAYHLWWHPHNFGQRTTENLMFLNAILRRYSILKARYGFRSLNMGEIADQAMEGGTAVVGSSRYPRG
jgi:peptidoglycan/xylan/chitin deacetylase (PgdA/CDA1 family)